ncbi:MAG: hypothetical protein KC414_07070, partial [Romboutsia sp.]|nr:hypothetical protein [Romboutsia sp.]
SSIINRGLVIIPMGNNQAHDKLNKYFNNKNIPLPEVTADNNSLTISICFQFELNLLAIIYFLVLNFNI